MSATLRLALDEPDPSTAAPPPMTRMSGAGSGQAAKLSLLDDELSEVVFELSWIGCA